MCLNKDYKYYIICIYTYTFEKSQQKEAILLTNATNYTENKETKIKSKPKYLVHFVDPKDSINDVYYYIYWK